MTSHYQGITFGYEVSTCPEGGQDRAVPARGAAGGLLRGPAGLGEDALRDHGDGRRGPGAQAAARRRARRRAEGVRLPGPRRGAARRPAGRVGEGRRAKASRWSGRSIGLDQCVAAISGAAPIAVEVFDFFRALGVPISEIYGMSESSGPMTWAPFRIKAGTVGPEIPGCEVRLAEDGEVDLPGRQRVPWLPRRPGEDRRGARRRRLAALRRHRRARRRRLPAHRRPQEGADHHRGREERLARRTSRPRSRPRS